MRPHLSDLAGRRVLDVGCGNGYSLLRMAGAGTRLAVGAEPSWLPNLQFAALCAFLEPAPPVGIVPARLEELPGDARFDTVFSLGVLSHQRRPEAHLRELRRRLRPGGELALETLVAAAAPGGELADPGSLRGHAQRLAAAVAGAGAGVAGGGGLRRAALRRSNGDPAGGAVPHGVDAGPVASRPSRPGGPVPHR